MKKLLAVLLTSALLACSGGGGNPDDILSEPSPSEISCPEAEYPTSIRQWEELGIDWVDVDKDWIDDSEMCWAAVAANMLEYGGYAADADDVFNQFRNVFDNEAGHISTALQWYFDNVMQDGRQVEDVLTRTDRTPELMDSLVCGLHAGDVVALQTEEHTGKNHIFSVYGYVYWDEIDFFGIYLTDSNALVNHLSLYYFKWTGSGWVSSGRKLTHVYRMEVNY